LTAAEISHISTITHAAVRTVVKKENKSKISSDTWRNGVKNSLGFSSSKTQIPKSSPIGALRGVNFGTGLIKSVSS
jgi:hypothetical protein